MSETKCIEVWRKDALGMLLRGSEKCSFALLILGAFMTLRVLGWWSGRNEAASGIIVEGRNRTQIILNQ